MRRRLFPSFLLITSLLASGSGLQAVVTEFTWAGGGSPTDSTDTANWSGGTVPVGTGSANENVTFGTATGSAQTVTIPNTGIILHNLTFNGSTRPAYTFNGTDTLVFTGDLTADAGGAISFSSSLGIRLSSDGENNNGHTVTINDSSLIVSILGNITDNGGEASITKSGDGILTLSGTNNYSEGTTLSGGTLNLNNASAIGNGSLTIDGSGVILGNTSGSAIALSTENHIYWYSNFTFVGPSDLNLGTGTVNLEGSRSVNVSTGTLKIGGAISNGEVSGALTKTGSGTLVLSGANNYTAGSTIEAGRIHAEHNTALGTGTVTMNGGTLSLNSGVTLANALSITASTSSKLAGNGTFSSLINLPTGTGISPGLNDAGTLTFSGGLSLTGGAVMDFDLGTISDMILVTGGTLTGPSAGTVTLNLQAVSGFVAGTYTLIDWTGASAVDMLAASFNIGNLPANWTAGDFTLLVNGSTLQLVAVPEPSTYALLALGLGLVALTARRRLRA